MNKTTYYVFHKLKQVCVMGKDPKYVCWKASSSKSGDVAAVPSNTVAQVQSTSNEGGSSDEEEEDEEEQSSNQAQVKQDTSCYLM